MDQNDVLARIWEAHEAGELVTACAWCGRVRIEQEWFALRPRRSRLLTRRGRCRIRSARAVLKPSQHRRATRNLRGKENSPRPAERTEKVQPLRVRCSALAAGRSHRRAYCRSRAPARHSLRSDSSSGGHTPEQTTPVTCEGWAAASTSAVSSSARSASGSAGRLLRPKPRGSTTTHLYSPPSSSSGVWISLTLRA